MREKLLKLKEVAELLRVSERYVFRYIDSGRLKATKVGYWRINEKDLKNFLEDNTNLRRRKKK